MRRKDIDYLVLFGSSEDPVLTAPEIAEELDISQQGAHSRLKSLEQKGFVESKKAGAKARVYWLSDEGKDYVIETLASE